MRGTMKGPATGMLAGVLACLLATPSAFAAEHTMLVGARIHTMDPQQPQAEAMVWNADGVLVADEVLAKHDENYMPPEVTQALEKSGMMKHYEGGKQEYAK
mgnify:FL=1